MSSDDVKWDWTEQFMRWLTGFAVLLCAVGFIAPAVSGAVNWVALVVGLFLSAVCALCLLLSNASAANAQLYFTSGRWLSFLVAAGIFIGGGLVSMTSMHMGWTVFSGWVTGFPLPTDDQMTWAFAFVAFVKPGINWNIQSLKDIKAERMRVEEARAKADAADREARLTPPRPADPPAFRPRLVETPVEAAETGVAGRVAVGTAVAAVALNGAAAAQPVAPGDVQLPLLESVAHSERTFADPDAHAIHLIRHEGVRQRNVLARKVSSLSTYRAAQLLDEHAPGWRARKRAA